MAKEKKPKSLPNKPRKERLRDLYARIRQEFTAADLQRYTVEEEGIPAEQVLADMEAIHRREIRKHRPA
jgi:hypothetical protein